MPREVGQRSCPTCEAGNAGLTVRGHPCPTSAALRRTALVFACRPRGSGNSENVMSNRIRIAAFIGLSLLASLAAAKGSPDARATALIKELGLEEAPIASRDLPGWQAPRRV